MQFGNRFVALGEDMLIPGIVASAKGGGVPTGFRVLRNGNGVMLKSGDSRPMYVGA